MLPLRDSFLYYQLLELSQEPPVGYGQLIRASYRGFTVCDPQPEDEVLQAVHEEVAYGGTQAVYLLLNQGDGLTVHACGPESSFEIRPQTLRAEARERPSSLAA